MKKNLSLVLVLMLMVILPKAMAQQFESVAPTGQMLIYSLDNGEAVVTGHGEISGALTIPSSVTYENVSYPVTRIQSWAFSSTTGMTSVTLPSTLTYIQDYAFQSCTGLTLVTIPASVTRMDYAAFNECTSLAQVNYGGTLAQWMAIDFDWYGNPLIYGHHLYIDGQEVTALVVPEEVSIIKRYAFHGCTGLETVTFPSTLDSVCDGAFNDCSGLARVYCNSLTDWCHIGFASEQSNPIYWSRKFYIGNTRIVNTLTIPEGVTEIKPYAFFRLNQVYNVELPEGLLRIGHRAFWEWEWNVTYIVPSTVTSIGEYALHGNGTVYYNAMNCNVVRNETGNAGAVAIPHVNRLVVGEGVQRIPRYLLPYDDYLSVLQMKGSTPPQVANFAFDNMRSRVVVKVPCGQTATYRAANGWSELTDNTFQETPPYTFQLGLAEHGWTSLEREATCTLPVRFSAGANENWHFLRWSDGVTDNPRELVLTQDTFLTPLYGPDRYDTLDNGLVLFYRPNATGLTLERVYGTITGTFAIPDSVMYDDAMMPVTEIRCGDLNEQRNMTSVTLPKGLTYCAGFYECTGLTRVDFEGTLAQWCNIQFENWHSNPTRYAHHLYIGGEEVLNPVIPEGVTALRYQTFSGLNNMTTITLPTSLDTVEPDAFESCSGLVRVNYNGTLGDWCSIGFQESNSNPLTYAHNLYIGGSKVTELVIPEGVTEIKQRAFQGIQNIRRVVLPEGLQSIGRYAFVDTWPDDGFTIPSTVTYIGEGATRGDKIYYNAINCTNFENNAFYEGNTVVVGENVQVLPTNFFRNNLWTLKMKGLPPVVEDYALDRLPEGSQVQVPCGMASVYHEAPNWSAVPNLSEAPAFNITFGQAEHGRAYVQAEATCTTPAQIRAENDGYYHFTRWTDGNTNNPRSVTLTQDTMFTPEFALDNYTVAVEVNDTTQGWVAINGQSWGKRTEISVQALDTITIEAHAKPGNRFVRWDDWDYNNYNDSVRRVPAHGDRTYHPQFESHSLCDTLMDGVVFCYTYRNGGMELYSVSSNISGDVIIPDSVMYEGVKYPVTSIRNWVFGERQSVTTITLPATIHFIGYEAFYNMQGLSRVNYNGTIAQWCAIDFESYWSNPVVNNGVRRLFIDNQEVVDLIIPEGVTSVGRNAFREFNYVATITLPSTLDTVGYDAFEGCNNLLRVNYGGTLAQWCQIGFYEDWGSNPLIHCGKLYIGGSRLTNLVIPEGVTVIKPYVFQNLGGISSVTLPEGVQRIGRYAFDMWTNTVTIPSTVSYIGEGAIRAGTVYYNAVNCNQVGNNALEVNTLIVGEGVQSLSAYIFTNSIYRIKMQGNPPTIASYALDRLREDAQVVVKCGLLNLYQEHAVWSTLGDRLTESNTYAIQFTPVDYAEAWVGTDATCNTPAQIQARGNDHHHFMMWSDGVTDNPRTIELTQDTLLTPVVAIDTYYVVPVVCDNRNERGYVTGGDTVTAGGIVSIAAYANTGYHFTGWSDGNGEAVRSYEAWYSDNICANFEAVQYEQGQLYYRYTGRGMVVMGHNGDIEGHLVIPDTVTFNNVNYPVIGIDSWALSSQGNMTAVTLPATMDSLWYCALAYNDNLSAVHYTGTLAQWCHIWFENREANPTNYAHHLYIGGEEILNLVIPEGVTSIGQYAFRGCNQMANVTLPSTLQSIGFGAFEDCNSIGRTRFTGTAAQWCQIDFAEPSSNPINFSRNFFLGNKRVTDLVIPAGATEIKPYAFYRCNSLTSVTMSDDIQTIGMFAFESCDNLTTVNFSSNITYIDMSAFRSCGNVRRFDLPESLEAIDSWAFWDCWNAVVVIPANVTALASEVLYTGREVIFNAVNCTQMANNAIPYNNTIVVGEGVQVLPYGLINNNISTLKMQCPPPTVMNYALDKLSNNATVQVKCGLLNLYQANDEWNELNLVEANIHTITFGNSEHGNAGIEQQATCTSPARIRAWSYDNWHFGHWSDGVRDNPREIMLTQDTVLTPIFFEDFYDTMPDGSIFYYYYNGEGLTLGGINGTLSGDIVIPDSVLYDGELLPVTRVWTSDFHEQRAMTSITLPKGVTAVSDFWECTGLTRVNYNGTLEQWCNINFDYWASNPTNYAHRLFIGGEEVINLVIPEGITKIRKYAFTGLNNMVSVTLPATIDTIECEVFNGCDGLRRTNYNGTIADWCDIVFCDGWGSNPNARSSTFYIGGNKVTSVVLPEGITEIKPFVFYGLGNVTSVELPEGLQSIGRYAFENTNTQEGFTIPSTVTSIGEYAFSSGSIVFFNAANCTDMATNAFPYYYTVVIGEGVQTLPTNLITQHISYLKMQGNPPAVTEYTLERLREDAQVQVKCGLLSTYQSTPVWDSVNLVETNTYTLKFGIANHGHAEVWTQATCTTPARVYAYSDNYYHFTSWSDGHTDNPRTIELTQDTMLTPMFVIDTYTVEVSLYDTLQGWASGGGTVQALDSVTIEVHAYPGFNFLRWDDWDEGWEDTVRTLVATGNRTYHPQFDPIRYCDSMSNGVTICYYYNGCGMTLQSVSGTINGIFAIPDSVIYEGWTIPVTAIDGEAFNGQNNMTWITLPKGLTRVGCNAFNGCDNLMRVNWNGTIEQWCYIDFDCWASNPINYARHLFMDNREVINLVIPEGIRIIKQYAFMHLSSIASVTLPSTLDSIGYAAFDDCNGLRRTNFSGTVADWCRISFADGWNAQPINYSRNLYIGGEVVNSLVIPEGITAIKRYAFSHLGTLHSLQLPEGLLSIGEYAFYDCNWGLNVTIPSTVNRIEHEAIMSGGTLFYNAVNCEYIANNALPYFTTVYIDDLVQSIPTYLITGNIQRLKMQGYPPSVTGDVLDRLDSNALVYVPCGLLSTYQSTPVWQDANLVESNTYALKFGQLNHGNANIDVEPTCTTAAQVSAGGDWKWHFTQWADGVTDNPRTINLTQDTVLTPLFVIDTYYVYGNVWPSTEYGMVLGNDTVPADETVTLSVVANYGYHFMYWSDGSTDMVRTIVAEGNWWQDAYFERNQYEVSLAAHDSTPYGQAYGAGTYYYLDNVYLYAYADYGYHFVQWSDSVTDNPRYISLTQDTTLTAEFAINRYTVAAQANFGERGVATVSDTLVTHMDSVVATATPNYGYHFIQWSDGVNDNPRTSQVTADVVYIAQFGFNQYNIGLAVDDAIHGTVSGGGNYNYLSSRTIIATPAYGYHFTQWNDSVTDNPRTVTLTQDTAFTAQFAKNTYTVTALTADAVKGSVSGTATVEYLDTVTIEATANYGYHFTQWVDGVVNNPRQVIATGNDTYTAQFGFNQYNVTLAVDSAIHGSVTGDGSYNYLTNVTLEATANYGYHFTQWSDGVTDNPRTVTLTQDTAFTAQFAKNTYTVTALTADAVKGSVSGTATVEYLDTVTIEATANYGYHFTQWVDGVVNNPRQVIATGNDTYTAQFDFNQYNVTLAVDSAIHGSVSGDGSYNYLTSVTLEATANYGYHFIRWDDGVTDNPRTVTLTQDTAFTALYAHNLYTLTVNSNNDSLGTVIGGGTYEYLDEVQLAAMVEAAHHHFVQWSDGVTESVRTVMVTEDLALTAIFAIDTHLVATVARLGTADSVADYASCGTVIGAGSYPYGTVLNLEANAATGYHFAEWDNGEQTLTRIITVTQDTLIAAVFTDDVTPSLCMVSVQDDRNVVIWTKDYEVNRYNIYRESNTSGVYAIVAVVPFNSASSWVDTTSRPSSRSYRYKMTAVDVYGYESDFSSVHKTMHLTISPGMSNRTWNLVWTEYEGADFVSYMIYRFSNSNGLEMIDQMPVGGNTTYTDEDAPGSTKYYQVAAIKSTPCNITKSESVIRSNIAVTDNNVGISDVSSDNVEIFSTENGIVVQGAEGGDVYVYDVNGRVIDQKLNVLATVEFHITASGVYFVKVGKAPAKRVVVVR